MAGYWTIQPIDSSLNRLLMDFAQTGPEVVKAVNQRWLLKQWDLLREGTRLPRWRYLPVEDLKPIQDTLMVCDVVPDDADQRFLIKYLGAQIAKAYGGDFRGRHLDEALPDIWRENALKTYRKTIDGGLPVYNAVDIRHRDGCLVHMERLLLPFSSDGRTADRILASIETVSLEGRFAQDNLGQSPGATSSCALVATIVMDRRQASLKTPRPVAS